MYTHPLLEGQFFHLYNRGVNGENLFKNEDSYRVFLEQYRYYCGKVFETWAWCLLKNHFHLLVWIKKDPAEPRRDGPGLFRLNASRQLGHLFNSFAQKVNKVHRRTGPLFESPFERKWVDNEDYLTRLVRYCHLNPVHHGFVKDCREWPHSSYHDILANNNEWVEAGKVLERFGGAAAFEQAHRTGVKEKDEEAYGIEHETESRPQRVWITLDRRGVHY